MTTTTIPQRAWVEHIMGLPISVHMRGDDSDLTRWERGKLAVSDADPMLAPVITLCAEASQRTGGWLDPHGLPDPFGLVKGWAVENAARHLGTLSGYGWCVNAGGDILVHTPEDQPPWRVGVENPNDPARIMSVVERRTGAVATSGSAHRGWILILTGTRR